MRDVQHIHEGSAADQVVTQGLPARAPMGSADGHLASDGGLIECQLERWAVLPCLASLVAFGQHHPLRGLGCADAI
jgi:hypothetical protein